MSDEHVHGEHNEFGLVMPFVVCESQGGPYEDGAFVAGWHCGHIDLLLAQQPAEYQDTVRVDSLPQFDLIAMRHGYTMTVEPYDDFWTTVIFTKTEDEP